MNDGPTPNPGSLPAMAKGCTCPVIDNAHGDGAGHMIDEHGERQPVFVFRETCPLHGDGNWRERDA